MRRIFYTSNGNMYLDYLALVSMANELGIGLADTAAETIPQAHLGNEAQYHLVHIN